MQMKTIRPQNLLRLNIHIVVLRFGDIEKDASKSQLIREISSVQLNCIHSKMIVLTLKFRINFLRFRFEIE